MVFIQAQSSVLGATSSYTHACMAKKQYTLLDSLPQGYNNPESLQVQRYHAVFPSRSRVPSTKQQD
eukprot:1400149-Ditylum_brightwellii.AAC.1